MKWLMSAQDERPTAEEACSSEILKELVREVEALSPDEVVPTS